MPKQNFAEELWWLEENERKKEAAVTFVEYIQS